MNGTDLINFTAGILLGMLILAIAGNLLQVCRTPTVPQQIQEYEEEQGIHGTINGQYGSDYITCTNQGCTHYTDYPPRAKLQIKQVKDL